MKLKESKGNKSEKEVKPVKKSVALILTIITVFAFAAACFSLGFCSGKNIERAEAVPGNPVFYYLVEKPDVSVDLTFSGTFKWGSSLFLGFSIANNELRATTLSSYKVIYSEADGWNTLDANFNSTLMKYMYFQFTAPVGEVALWLNANSVKLAYVPFLMAGSYTFKESWLSNNESYNSRFIFTSNEETYQNFYIIYDSSNGISIKYDNTIVYTRDSGWSTGYQTIKISEDSAVSSFDFYSNFLTSTATYSSNTEIIEYTLTCEYEGALNYNVTYGTIGDITREGDIFTGQPGSSAYVRITPKDGYIMRNLSYQITDGSVASITPGSSNNYTIVLASSDATILFSVVATVQTVDISSGYYWIQSRVYGSDFSELTLQPGKFQIVESISNGSISWQDLTGLTCSSGRIVFRLAGDRRISVYTITSVTEEYGFTTGLDGQGAGWIISGNYDYNTTLWSANWYPVIYVPSNIMEGEAPDSLVAFFKSTSIYKAEPVFYNGMYLTSKSAVSTVDPLYNTYLSAYTPSSNALVSPSGISFVPYSAQVLDANFKSQLAFMGDVGARKYSIYTGYVWQENGTSVGYSRVGRIPPVSNSGTYGKSIYIAPTIMPASLYNAMSEWFDITVSPGVPDPPPSSYWDGLDEVLGYEIFGVPISSLLAIVISSVFVVVVIRLFAGG